MCMAFGYTFIQHTLVERLFIDKTTDKLNREYNNLYFNTMSLSSLQFIKATAAHILVFLDSLCHNDRIFSIQVLTGSEVY